MLFSIRHPEAPRILSTLTYGLQPVRERATGVFSLLIKTNKEAILAAKINREIKFYVVPDPRNEGKLLGIITAFFDDHDEPMVIRTPLYFDDPLGHDLAAFIAQGEADIYFFDEHDRELLGVRVEFANFADFKDRWAPGQLWELQGDCVPGDLSAMETWFGLRSPEDDARALTARFVEDHYPSDFLFMDIRPQAHDFEGGDAQAGGTSLEREEPGPEQERDIARLMRRIFPGPGVFLNPVRADDGKELCDILCVSDDHILAIQAKDSPNTEKTMRRTLARKRTTTRNHIEKGAGQLRGALQHITAHDILTISIEGALRSIRVDQRQVHGVVVVRELFDDDIIEPSKQVLVAAQACGIATTLLEYGALHQMALRLRSPDRLIEGLRELFIAACEHKQFPRPRFLHGPEPE